MNERSEKIVMLAREMLRDCSTAEPTRAHISMSFKVLCLTTLLTAAGSSAITALTYRQTQPIDHYEKTELEALVFYTAHLKGIDENTIRQQVTSRLGIAHFDDMTEQDFTVARRYLQKLAQ